ncbi:MAG: RNA polymerase sigma factor [Bacteroidota bacterium]
MTANDRDDLIQNVQNVLLGDKDQFREIMRACNQSLYRTSFAILKNETDAEDAVQSAYLKAYLHLNTFRKESSFLTWIMRILINECKMMLRHQKKTSTLDVDEVAQKHSITDSVMDALTKQQINQWLEQAVMALPEKYRLVYVVREINEMSTEKTALVLGITPENVKVRLHRAKSLIKENLLQKTTVQELFPFGKQRCNNLTEKVMQSIVQLSVPEWS